MRTSPFQVPLLLIQGWEVTGQEYASFTFNLAQIMSFWGKILCSFQLYAAAKSLQSCPTLCDPIDSSPPSSPVPGILQARTLEWVAISFSNAWKWKVKEWKWSCSVVSDSSRPHGLKPTRLLHPLDIPGKSTGVGCHTQHLLQSALWLWIS